MNHLLKDLAGRRRGFRCSPVDLAALALCAAGTIWLREPLGEMVWLAPVTLGHFFLFCNVFRIRRSYELIWAAVFILNVAGWSIGGEYSWGHVLAVQSPLTLLLISLEWRSPRYHGIFCDARRAGSHQSL
jgi:hypothetical protein